MKFLFWHGLVISSLAFINSVNITAPALAQKPIIGDCGGQKCDQLLAQLRKKWPQQVRNYESECSGKNTLGLQVYQNAGATKRVGFVCWEPKDSNGSRTGNWLGVLPFPGQEAGFKSEWNCDDKQCKNTLAKLRQRYPQKLQQYEFACATKNGVLLLNVLENNKQFEIECGFFASSLVDDNGDGVSDGDQPTSVSQILGKLELPK